MKIIFFGSGKFSGKYLDAFRGSSFDVVRVIGKDIPPASELKTLKPDIGVIAYFGKIIPKEILDIPERGILNVQF